MKHIQSGIEWKSGGRNQLQHRDNKWFLLTFKNGEVKETQVSRAVAKVLLEGGMSYGN